MPLFEGVGQPDFRKTSMESPLSWPGSVYVKPTILSTVFMTQYCMILALRNMVRLEDEAKSRSNPVQDSMLSPQAESDPSISATDQIEDESPKTMVERAKLYNLYWSRPYDSADLKHLGMCAIPSIGILCAAPFLGASMRARHFSHFWRNNVTRHGA